MSTPPESPEGRNDAHTLSTQAGALRHSSSTTVVNKSSSAAENRTASFSFVVDLGVSDKKTKRHHTPKKVLRNDKYKK